MNRATVHSRTIHSIGFENGILEIQFFKGGIYRYHDVPEALYHALMNAPSKTSFFARNIRGKFLTGKLNPQ